MTRQVALSLKMLRSAPRESSSLAYNYQQILKKYNDVQRPMTLEYLRTDRFDARGVDAMYQLCVSVLSLLLLS